MLKPDEIQHIIFINTLGLSVLLQTLRTASYVFLTSNQSGRPISGSGRTKKEAVECFAFIQGTGLELLLQRHHIDMDANTLRYGFYTAIGHRELIDAAS